MRIDYAHERRSSKIGAAEADQCLPSFRPDRRGSAARYQHLPSLRAGTRGAGEEGASRSLAGRESRRDRILECLGRGAWAAARRISAILMARFDVYARRARPGYLLDCQADVLSSFDTRFV